MNKPKTKEEQKTWCEVWDLASHQQKLMICEDYALTYDSARHWRTAFGVARIKKVTETETIDPDADVDTILGGRPAINLDFVSFDLETSNLKADFSILLTGVIKPFGKKPIIFRADSYPSWEKERGNDYQITKDIADELAKHAIIVGHYAGGFDIPYLQAKMVYHNLPQLPPKFLVDSYRIARRNFAVSRRRLEALGEYFDLGSKSGVDGGLWVDAAYNGSRTAMERIVKHNIVDCEILEKLACLTFCYLKAIPKA